jgi:hypothetical protein
MSVTLKRASVVTALLAVIAMLALLPPVAEGRGGRWSGIDPIITVGEHQFNVRIEYPSEYDCSLVSAIVVVVKVPLFMQRQLLTESIGLHGGCLQTSTTLFVPALFARDVDISVLAVSLSQHPVRVKVDRDNRWVASKEGLSNRVIRANDIQFSGRDMGIDPVIANLPPNTMEYTYLED